MAKKQSSGPSASTQTEEVNRLLETIDGLLSSKVRRHARECVPTRCSLTYGHDTYHASYGGGKRRRMFTMNCTTEPDLETLHQYVSIHSLGGYQIKTGTGMYFPAMVDTADDTRKRHLQQCSEIHDALFPQYARHS